MGREHARAGRLVVAGLVLTGLAAAGTSSAAMASQGAAAHGSVPAASLSAAEPLGSVGSGARTRGSLGGYRTEPDPAEGLWYFDRFHVQDAFDQGYTGKGVTVAVLDSLINPDLPTFKGANLEVREPSYCADAKTRRPLAATTTTYHQALHGTNVASYIIGSGAGYPGQKGVQGVAPQARVLYYAVGVGKPVEPGQPVFGNLTCTDTEGDAGLKTIALAIDDAVEDGAQIISISVHGTPFPELIRAVGDAVRKDVVVVASLSNEGEIEDAPPSTLNGVVSVQAIDSTGKIQQAFGKSNVDSNTDVTAPGVNLLVQGISDSWQAQHVTSGTSLATPIVAGFLALVKQKYPGATGNQLVQSLIRNTGGSEHEPRRDDTIGYGVVSLTGMLATDPTTYPDENPLISKDPDAVPSWEELTGSSPGTVSSSSSGPSSSSKAPTSPVRTRTAAASKGGSGGGAMPLIVGVGIAVVVVAVVVGVVVARRSRSGSRG